MPSATKTQHISTVQLETQHSISLANLSNNDSQTIKLKTIYLYQTIKNAEGGV